MGLKPPSMKNRSRRKKFFMEHIGYPGAIKELRKIFIVEMGILFDHRRELDKDEYFNRRQALIDEGKKNVETYESDIKGTSEVERIRL